MTRIDDRAAPRLTNFQIRAQALEDAARIADRMGWAGYPSDVASAIRQLAAQEADEASHAHPALSGND